MVDLQATQHSATCYITCFLFKFESVRRDSHDLSIQLMVSLMDGISFFKALRCLNLVCFWPQVCQQICHQIPTLIGHQRCRHLKPAITAPLPHSGKLQPRPGGGRDLRPALPGMAFHQAGVSCLQSLGRIWRVQAQPQPRFGPDGQEIVDFTPPQLPPGC